MARGKTIADAGGSDRFRDKWCDGDKPGSRTLVKARYTFIDAPEHGKWLIVHHHSSAQPIP